MPTIGDTYTKGNAVVEITRVTAKRVGYKILPGGSTVEVSLAEFEELARRSIERGAVFVGAGGGGDADEMSDPAFD